MSEWKVAIENDMQYMATLIYVYRKLPDNAIEFLVTGGDKAVVQPYATASKEKIWFARFQDETIAHQLAQALSDKNFTPPDKSFAEGELQATKQHLDDMRNLVFERSKQDE